MASYRCMTFWLALAPALFAAGMAGAVSVTDLYEATQPVTDSREAAFVDALKTVVVRVSGQRDAAERLGAELNDPRRYVQRYGLIADNILEVGFDSGSIDQLLSQAGLPIWGHERPVMLMLVSVVDANGSLRQLSGELPSPERRLIEDAARRRGLPLKWPATGTLGPGADIAAQGSLLQTAAAYGANAALVGRPQNGSMHWTLVSSEGGGQASGGLEEGVHLAADTFARVFAVSGSSLRSVMVEISGIADLDAYAGTLNYLEGMTLVRDVALEQVSGDTMRFRLAVRGDATTLLRAIALDNRLVPLMGAGAVSPPGASERLVFRYEP